jgi:hypothetical protein
MPCSPLKFYRRFGGIYRKAMLATCFHAGFLLDLFFDPEYGDRMFLRNIGWFQRTRWRFSSPLWGPHILHIFTCMTVTRDGVCIGNCFIEYLQIVTTCNYITIANPHTQLFTTARTNISLFSLLYPHQSLPAAGFTSSQTSGHLTLTSCPSNFHLKTIS